MRAATASAWLALCAASALAEVRIESTLGEPELIVRPAPEGTWTPLGGPTRRGVINPGGDLLGDGAPGSATAGDDIVVAWLRGDSELRVLAARERGACELGLPVHAAEGVPMVGTLGEAFLVLWTEDAAAPIVRAALWDDEPRQVFTVQPGRLLGIVPTEAGLRFVSLQGQASTLVVGDIPSSAPFLIPIPIPVQRIALVTDAGARFAASEPCVGSGPAGALRVALPLDPRRASVVDVHATSIEGPRTERSSMGSCQGILRPLR